MKSVMKYVKITQKDIENIEEDYFFVVQPMWSKGNIYRTYNIYEKSLANFTLPQRYLYAIEWLIAEVCNGGFYQFFDNSTGIVWEDAYKGFSQIGSEKMIAIMDKILEIFKEEPSKDREKRQDKLESFDDDIIDKLDDLSSEFYDINDEIYKQISTYIKSNSKDFIFEGEIEVFE